MNPDPTTDAPGVASHALLEVGAVRWRTGHTAGGIIEHYSKWHLWMQDGGKTLCGRNTPPYAPHAKTADAVTCATCRKIHTSNSK